MANQITTATNVTGPDISLASSQIDTRKYFNNFYSGPMNISSRDNDAVVGFFERYTQNKTAAKNLSAALVYTAMAQNVNPLTVLGEFEKMPVGQINSYLAAFLNSNRAPTSALGIKDSTKTSPYITRTIIL